MQKIFTNQRLQLIQFYIGLPRFKLYKNKHL